jgi:hypothetical protein
MAEGDMIIRARKTLDRKLETLSQSMLPASEAK